MAVEACPIPPDSFSAAFARCGAESRSGVCLCLPSYDASSNSNRPAVRTKRIQYLHLPLRARLGPSRLVDEDCEQQDNIRSSNV